MFQQMLSARLAANILLISLGLLALFHGLVMLGVLPPNIVWGGQAGESPADLLVLETIALVVIALFAWIIAAKAGYVQVRRFRRGIIIGVWLVFAFLLLNTVGNLASGVTAEKLIFTPITLLLALCAYRVAIAPS